MRKSNCFILCLVLFIVSCSESNTKEHAMSEDSKSSGATAKTEENVSAIKVNDESNVVKNTTPYVVKDSIAGDKDPNRVLECTGDACGSVSYRYSNGNYFKNTGSKSLNVYLKNWAASETIPLSAGEEKRSFLQAFEVPYGARY